MGARLGLGLASAAVVYGCGSSSADEGDVAPPAGAASSSAPPPAEEDVHNVLDYDSPQAAVDAAAAAGGTVLFPPGNYRVRSLILERPGGPVTLIGDQAMLIGSDQREAVLRITDASGFVIQNLTIRHERATDRITNSDGIRILRARDFSIEGVTVEDAAGAGILVSEGVGGSIVNSTVQSWADGIHLADGSRDITVQGCRTQDTGDDGIAVIGYRAQHPPCRNIRILDNTVYRSSARGITVLGGQNVIVARNQIDLTSVAGILVGYDSYWQTYGAEDITIENNTISNANIHEGPRVDQAGIDIRSNSVTYPARRIRVIGNTINRGGWRMINVGESGREIGVSDVTIEGNQLAGPNGDGAGIHAILTRDLVIVKNTITAAHEQGFYIAADCAGTIRVVDNALIRCNQGVSPFYRVLVADASVSGNTATP